MAWYTTHYADNQLKDVVIADDIIKWGAKFAPYLEFAGTALVIVGVVFDVKEIAESDNKIKKTTEKAGAWAGAYAGAELGLMAGALCGPAAVICSPVAALAGGAGGYLVGSEVGKAVYEIGKSAYNAVTPVVVKAANDFIDSSSKALSNAGSAVSNFFSKLW